MILAPPIAERTGSNGNLLRHVPSKPEPAHQAAAGDRLGFVRDEVLLRPFLRLPHSVERPVSENGGAWLPTAEVSPSQPPVVRLAEARPVDYAFDLLQQWEGVVQAVGSDEFDVVLRDLTDPSRPEESAVIGLEEVSPDDRSLLQVGAVLYWSIGYETSRTGQVKRVSMIRLRRLPAWSKRDVERVQKKAQELIDAFGVHDDTVRSSRCGEESMMNAIRIGASGRRETGAGNETD